MRRIFPTNSAVRAPLMQSTCPTFSRYRTQSLPKFHMKRLPRHSALGCWVSTVPRPQCSAWWPINCLTIPLFPTVYMLFANAVIFLRDRYAHLPIGVLIYLIGCPPNRHPLPGQPNPCLRKILYIGIAAMFFGHSFMAMLPISYPSSDYL